MTRKGGAFPIRCRIRKRMCKARLARLRTPTVKASFHLIPAANAATSGDGSGFDVCQPHYDHMPRSLELHQAIGAAIPHCDDGADASPRQDAIGGLDLHQRPNVIQFPPSARSSFAPALVSYHRPRRIPSGPPQGDQQLDLGASVAGLGSLPDRVQRIASRSSRNRKPSPAWGASRRLGGTTLCNGKLTAPHSSAARYRMSVVEGGGASAAPA